MEKYSYLSNADISAIETLYNEYNKDPNTVDSGWQKFFEGFEFHRKNFEDDFNSESVIPESVSKEFKVINLINGYRTRGHLFTKTNPVRERRKYAPTLAIENFGLSNEDLNTVFQAGTQIGIGQSTLSDIIEHLKVTYCQAIGVEYMYIRTPEKIKWLQERMEGCKNTTDFSHDEKKHILHKLNNAVAFENFLHLKFTGQKRFSLEGAETLIPAFDALIEKGAEMGVKEFVVGMAHRGRLNVLANIFQKTYAEIFSEFEGKDYEDSLFDGDVKYHVGFASDVKMQNGEKVHLTLAANPSHLEAVDPVVAGMAKAKLHTKYHDDTNKLVPVLVHGDASIAGQGVVYEVVQMAHLDAYDVGGTIHIVINNQIGFTTNYLDARSSTYCTDVGKVTLCPVFHVNADDVEAVVYTIQLAMEYRQLYHKDVFIDLLGYRKYGHNEGDEPRFTQPILYKAISKHLNPREIYSQKLIGSGHIGAGLAKEMEKDFKHILQERLEDAKLIDKLSSSPQLEGIWRDIKRATKDDFVVSPDTGFDIKQLVKIAEKINTVSPGKKLFKKLERILKGRQDMVKDGEILDWGLCELLAYGTLLHEGYSVRFTGQDVERGTFSHRHAVLKIEDSEEEFIPLTEIGKKNADFQIHNSLLSEYGVLGFEYGYSWAHPNCLTIWEAQFGDFSNGAQIIIDQFISSAEDKWRRMSSLVMLLPHGYEGQGPEHSSARIERYLQLCAENNMVVANCSTPANFFHILRRQLHWAFRKPLIVITPKSLLRHPMCISSINDLSKGKFCEIIDHPGIRHKDVARVVFCSGKIYYDLLEYYNDNNIKDVAIIRIEQLYPFPIEQLRELIPKYAKAKRWMWVQEEPENMGAWSHVMRVFRDVPLEAITRIESASPATGSSERHKRTQKELIEQVFEKGVPVSS